MRYFAALLLSCWLSLAVAAPRQPVTFDFQAVPVGQIVQLVFSEVTEAPYVIAPAVLQDDRRVSFRYTAADGVFRPFLLAFLRSLGLEVVREGGVDFVRVADVPAPVDPETELMVYVPLYRDVTYLARVIGPLVHGAVNVNRSVRSSVPLSPEKSLPPASAAALVDQGSDTLVYSGSPRDVALLRKLLPQLDTKVGEVFVRGAVYEVSSSEKAGSGFSLALGLLGSRFSVGIDAGQPLNSFLQIKGGDIEAVLSALSGDSRFQVVSTPSLRVRSGGSGSFTVGQDVPVLGAVSYPGNGAPPVQSIEYRSSGVIFDLSPVVHASSVDLRVSQQLSNFVSTQTGVNGSPTLIKRQVSTDLTMSDGDVVLLGGLAETKDSAGTSGLPFLPAFMRSESSERSRSEILLVLQLNRL